MFNKILGDIFSWDKFRPFSTFFGHFRLFSTFFGSFGRFRQFSAVFDFFRLFPFFCGFFFTFFGHFRSFSAVFDLFRQFSVVFGVFGQNKHQAVLDDPSSVVLNADDEEDDEPDAKKAALTEPRSHGKVPILDGDREKLIFHPHHGLQEIEIDQYLILARAVGTFARALDGTCATKIPTLHIAAAAASRDITLFHALALLHHADYERAIWEDIFIIKTCQTPKSTVYF